MSDINISGLASIIVFYLLILIVGLWAGWKKRKMSSNPEGAMLANRDMGSFVGIMTMTATWVGGGYVNGSAEEAYTTGVVWCQGPFGYALALLIGGAFFAKPMYDRGYTTLLDPFQEKYGSKIGGLLFLPAIMGNILWGAAILTALGSTLSVILGLDNTVAVLTSAGVAVLYTLFGGLYSVAFTDVIQLCCIAIGLALCVPFAWSSPYVDREILIPGSWEGTIESYQIAGYIENYLLLILGGIPVQDYFQRVLACRKAKQAQIISYCAGLGAIILAAPPICLGVIARAADWNNATSGQFNVTSEENGRMILPLVLQYLTPQWVSFIGLGAVSAAVMSSADSAILSASTMFARNIYQNVLMPSASEKHVMKVMWVGIVLTAAASSSIALTVKSVYGLFVMCSDLVYVLLFPHLFLVLYWNEKSNSYGCLVSLMIAFILRVLAGEPLLGLPVVLKFPYYDPELGQLFPFRTVCMIICIITHCSVSTVTMYIFKKKYLPSRFDVLKVYREDKNVPDLPVNLIPLLRTRVPN